MSNSREKILNRIREASTIPSTLPSFPDQTDNIFEQKFNDTIPSNSVELLNQFKKEIEVLSAEFFLVNDLMDIPSILYKVFKEGDSKKFVITDNKDCQSIAEKIKEIDAEYSYILATEIKSNHRKDELANIPVALVKASYAVADIGSLVFPYDENGTSLPHFLSDCVIALVERNQLLPNQFDLLKKVDVEKSKNMVFVAGPSRTADIEKVLVLGAHGPRRFIVIMIDG